MRKKLFLSAFVLVFVFSTVFVGSVGAETDYAAQIVKMEGLDTLYYVTAEGNRYVFPNEKTYKSWFYDFSDVATISQAELEALPLSGNIRYRPGVVLIKIQTDPKVYTVTQNGVLRWVKTEAKAKQMFGENWNQLVDDIADSFFTNYTIGEPIEEGEEYDVEAEVANTETIEANRGLKLGHAKRANTTQCRAEPATPAVPGHKGGETIPAVPATSARVCKMDQAQNSGEEEPEEDATAPVISDIIATSTTATGITITWTTDEESSSEVEYASENLPSASSTIVSDPSYVTEHSVSLTGLTASTTYYYIVESADASGNTATSSEDTFTTE